MKFHPIQVKNNEAINFHLDTRGQPTVYYVNHHNLPFSVWQFSAASKDLFRIANFFTSLLKMCVWKDTSGCVYTEIIQTFCDF